MEFYKIQDYEANLFYQLPKFLLDNEKYKELGNDGRILYALLRDRHSLSKSNNWIDKNNSIYFIYTREEMARVLNLTLPTVRKAVKQLKEYDLIWEKRQGRGRPNLIYLLKPSFENNALQEKENGSIQKEKILPSRKKKNYSVEGKNFSCNNTDTNNTDINNLSIIEMEIEKKKVLKELKNLKSIKYPVW